MQGTNSIRSNDLDQTVDFISQDSELYPSGLKQLPAAPLQLYYRGDLSLASRLENNIAIVGTRKASIYGKTCSQSLVAALAAYDTCIASGMAYGIDSAAHEAALTMGVPTIAVLGCGLLDDSVIANPLYKSILVKGGLIVSEYSPHYPAQKWTFRDRNRIISALSCATVIVEAPKGSGALITADITKHLKRPLYALSGEINKTNFQGNMELLSSGAASPIFSTKLWAESLKLNKRDCQKPSTSTNPILELIGAEPISIDTLIQTSKLSPGALSAELSKLTTKGYIRKIFGQKYIRVELN
jgi:DNA processing protein